MKIDMKTWITVFVIGILVIGVLSEVVPFTHAGQNTFKGTDLGETVSKENTFMQSFTMLAALFTVALFTLFLIIDGDDYLNRKK